MKVIKRNGREQKFDLDKIKISIERASDDTKIPLTRSDSENISKKIEKDILRDYKEFINYTQIRKVVEKNLVKEGFEKIAEAYKNI
ncbi:ATP cone domain-containing protein [Haloimpatiens sp. FM7315]|uniref:ATP cone domain-containing protein n=1 Tax=Haloimpatiens sp. FM7315 TaxID=3298609 RepID=UPI0035A3C244